jgi:hypothetical protein
MKLILALSAALLINLPLYVYQNGERYLATWAIAIGWPFLFIALIEPFRNTGRLKRFLEQRSFNGMLFRAVLCSLPMFVTNVFGAVSPTFYSGGLQVGMMVGLLTPTRYATLDQPQLASKRYWVWSTAVFGTALGFAVFLFGGHTFPALAKAVGSALVYAGGLWFGLLLGNQVTQWVAALAPTFRLLRQMSRILSAFAVGYVGSARLLARNPHVLRDRALLAHNPLIRWALQQILRIGPGKSHSIHLETLERWFGVSSSRRTMPRAAFFSMYVPVPPTAMSPYPTNRPARAVLQ